VVSGVSFCVRVTRPPASSSLPALPPTILSLQGRSLQLSKPQCRVLMLAGMSANVGAFFGAPVGGAFLTLELPHRRVLCPRTRLTQCAPSPPPTQWRHRTAICGMCSLLAACVPQLTRCCADRVLSTWKRWALP